jgi:hypothetical protein
MDWYFRIIQEHDSSGLSACPFNIENAQSTDESLRATELKSRLIICTALGT